MAEQATPPPSGDARPRRSYDDSAAAYDDHSDPVPVSPHDHGRSVASAAPQTVGAVAPQANPVASQPTATVASPPRDPGFVDVLTRRIGGWRGAHEAPMPQSVPLIVSMVFACATWLACALRQLPCQPTLTTWPNAYYRLCYSDIPVLFQNRKLYEDTNPYGMEYPVLTGTLIQVSKAITQVFGGRTGTQLTWPETLHTLVLFTYVTGALLFLCYLGVVWCHVKMTPTRPWDAMMIAAAPVVAAAGLVNWDMLCLLFTALALLFWARGKPMLAGVFIGLGVAAKLYTGLLLIPLFALCLRERKAIEFGQTAVAAVLAWGIPNGIIYSLYPAEWSVFWTFNQDRGPDLGSLWYAAKLAGMDVPDHISVPMIILFAMGVMAVLALGFFAPRRPRLGSLAYLMVAWFLIVNKVYSPQYVVWLLPFVVLARPRWRDYLIWTVGELAYFAAIWGHLANTLVPPGGGTDKIYVAAVLLRVGVEVWLGATIVLDALNPAHDIVRADGTDDPIGGILARRRPSAAHAPGPDHPSPGPGRDDLGDTTGHDRRPLPAAP